MSRTSRSESAKGPTPSEAAEVSGADFATAVDLWCSMIAPPIAKPPPRPTNALALLARSPARCRSAVRPADSRAPAPGQSLAASRAARTPPGAGDAVVRAEDHGGANDTARYREPCGRAAGVSPRPPPVVMAGRRSPLLVTALDHVPARRARSCRKHRPGGNQLLVGGPFRHGTETGPKPKRWR